MVKKRASMGLVIERLVEGGLRTRVGRREAFVREMVALVMDSLKRASRSWA